MSGNTTEIRDLLDDVLDPVLWVVTARSGDEQSGLIATFVNKASIVPDMPRMMVAIARHHYTWSLIERSQSFAIHVVGESRLEWVSRFGLHSGKNVHKFTGLNTKTGVMGSPLLEEAILWMECRVEASLDTGDRTVYVADIVSAGKGTDDRPLRLKRMLELLSPDQRSELKHMLAKDIEVDAAAIRAW